MKKSTKRFLYLAVCTAVFVLTWTAFGQDLVSGAVAFLIGFTVASFYEWVHLV